MGEFDTSIFKAINDPDKRSVIENVFKQYDEYKTGELNKIQVQTLYGDIRMGGLSLPQVIASMNYVCVTDKCHLNELVDLMQELDRRYYLVQDYRWEFSFLDQDQTDTITIEQARWLVQTVRGRLFSQAKWNKFIQSRAVPSTGISFAEIEVMLCDIPSKTSLEEEEKERERLLREKRKRQEAHEAELRAERERRQKDKAAERKRLEEERLREEEERRKRERDEETSTSESDSDHDTDDKKKEEEERKRREAEELKRLEEEARKKREAEERMYEDAEIHKEAAMRAEEDADKELSRIQREKEAADEKRRKELEEEEERQRKLKKDNRNKKIRYQLKVAIKSRDKFELEYSIGEFKKAKLSDDDMDLDRATRLLKQLSAKDGLHKAMSKKEIEELERAMTFVRKNGFEVELAREMVMAGNMLNRLRRLERIRHEILELKQATVAEIRSYQNPPVIVHTVMTGTFLLLGHKEKETKDWKAVQALVGKTGKESLKRRCLELDAAKLPLGPAKRAKKLLDKFELDEVRDISAGAATFFVWATAMIEEALDDTAEPVPEADNIAEAVTENKPKVEAEKTPE